MSEGTTGPEGIAPTPAPSGDSLPPLATERGIRARLSAAGLRPQHRLGQNFICHAGILTAVVESAELSGSDRVLEIGAGLGTLTVELAKRAGWVVAVELDRALLHLLPAELERQRADNASVVAGDILALSDQELQLPATGQPFKVVANLPYYLTSAMIERILDSWPAAQLAVLMLQEEVARRLVAAPATEAYGALSVFVQYHAEPELVRLIPPNAFWPRPAVRSAIVRLRRRTEPAVTDVKAGQLFAVVRAAFGQRRKQLRNSLGGPPLDLGREAIDAALFGARVDGSRRAEDLSLAEFAAIARHLPAGTGGDAGDPEVPQRTDQ